MLLFLCLREPINQSLSVSCLRFGTVPRFSKDETNQPVPEYGVLGGRCSPRLSRGQTGRPVPEHLMLGGRYSPQDVEWADRSTSPRACHARWSVQSQGCRMGRLVDQSPSMSCSWSVQSLGCRMGRLVDQSPSMSCSMVGTVPIYIMSV